MTLPDLIARVAAQPGVLHARLVASKDGTLTVEVGRRLSTDWATVVGAVREAVGPELPPGITLELVELR